LEAFEEKFALFCQAMASGRPPVDPQIRAWVHSQREEARAGRLSPERRQRLQEAGVFDVHMQRNRAKTTVQTGSEQ
jgi:hypothetical protein